MKITILLALFTLPLFTVAQNTGDNTIVLKGADISFKDLAKKIAAAGYEIELMTEDVGQIGTRYARVKDYDFSSRVKINYNKDSITAQGLLRMDRRVSGVWEKGQEDLVSFVGKPKSAHKYTFSQILNLMTSISQSNGGQITTLNK